MQFKIKKYFLKFFKHFSRLLESSYNIRLSLSWILWFFIRLFIWLQFFWLMLPPTLTIEVAKVPGVIFEVSCWGGSRSGIMRRTVRFRRCFKRVFVGLRLFIFAFIRRIILTITSITDFAYITGFIFRWFTDIVYITGFIVRWMSCFSVSRSF